MDDIGLTIARHRDAWLARWQASDIRTDGDIDAQRALRFAVYHLSSAANPEDDRVSIGARGLSGLAYMGHVFWDTESFMLPLFALTYPEAARALVMYRYHTLAGARAKAARLGYRGALYAWESADNGDEVTPPFVIAPDGKVIRILTGEQEHHISADVAFAVWSYWQATGDERFLLSAGAEILIETARFWASRASREDDRRYHIRGVIGPDEYHETVDDNAYTNGLAQWNLEVAEELTRLLAERWPHQWRELSLRLGLEAEEAAGWLRVARDLYTGFDERTGLFEQFQGYFGLEDIDLAAFGSRTVPMDVLLGAERIRRSQIIKQADVVMLIHLLWDRLPTEVRRANFEYYEPRCGHGSSLSPAVHALVAARLGKLVLAERYFRQAAQIDLANNMGNAAGGIHTGAMGGLWQAAVLGFAGVHPTQAGPRLQPCLPASWRSLSTQVQWRGHWHQLSVPDGVEDSRNERLTP
jgi:kojibiose phosphorylase